MERGKFHEGFDQPKICNLPTCPVKANYPAAAAAAED